MNLTDGWPHIGLFAGSLVSSFKLSDAKGEMRELADSIDTIRFSGSSPACDALLPMFSFSGYNRFRNAVDRKRLTAALRHHSQSKYDLEWKWLANEHPKFRLPLWHVVAFALCVQCAAEESLLMDSTGEIGPTPEIWVWLDRKAREHGKAFDVDGIEHDFLDICKQRLQDGQAMYERHGDNIQFVAFGDSTIAQLKN